MNVKHLKAIPMPEDLSFIVEFISERLASFIHHRNQLKHYRSSIWSFKVHFDPVSIDIDFSENLTVPVNYKPQSLHWSHSQVTVWDSEKRWRKKLSSFFSADRKHDQTFVKFAMEEMLNKAEIDPDKYIIIESDTCFS